jgi:magnesium transporter
LGPDYLLYDILDEIANSIFPILDSMDEVIDLLEDEIIERSTPQTLQRIFRLKQELIEMRRSIAPMRDVANALAGTRYGFVDNQTALYFRDAYDHLTRIHELIETQRDLLGSALDTYLSVVSNRLNDVMRQLTIIATIFLPISFIVGFGGMNFNQLPFDNSTLFGIIMASLILVPAVMLIYFWRKGWM